MRTISDLLKIYQNADALADDECERLAVHMEQLERLSFDAGERFVLQAAYAGHVARDCRSFLAARAKRKDY